MQRLIFGIATLVLGVCAAALAGRAYADSETSRIDTVVAELTKAGTADARQSAVAELVKLTPRAVPHVSALLTRTRQSSIEDRRAALAMIRASVPDASGKFETPKRQKEAQIRAEDEFDWLPEVAGLDAATPGATDVLIDVAAIRALSQSGDPAASKSIFDAAFAEPTMILRDECGRRLRKMSPTSLPILIREAQSRGDRARYASYQLERLDRQDPAKALVATIDDGGLQVAVLEAFRDTKHREAVYAVMTKIDDESPTVRAAARAAWLAYVTGPPPKPAPLRKMVLPGGKLADKATPLYLTYRELADHELRKRLEQLLGETHPEGSPLNLEAASQRLFAHFDEQRRQRDAGLLTAARAQVTSGDLAGATAAFDRLLVLDPQRPERAEMAPAFMAFGKQMAGEKKWQQAAESFIKAHALLPDSPEGRAALAAHHNALGMVVESGGGIGDPQFREAARIDPSYEPAAILHGATPDPNRGRWMLIVGSVAAALAACLLLMGLAKRRRLAK